VNSTLANARVPRLAKPRRSTKQNLHERTQEVIENIQSSSKKRAELPPNAPISSRFALLKCAFACAFRRSDAQSGSRKTSGAEQTYCGFNTLPASHLRAKNCFRQPQPASAILQRAVLN
jgi:hypothetical protein